VRPAVKKLRGFDPVYYDELLCVLSTLASTLISFVFARSAFVARDDRADEEPSQLAPQNSQQLVAVLSQLALHSGSPSMMSNKSRQDTAIMKSRNFRRTTTFFVPQSISTYSSFKLRSRMVLLTMAASARPASVRSLSSRLSSQLKNPSLLSIVGESPSLLTYDVRNPADPDSILAQVPAMNRDDARTCIERSRDRLEDWRDGTTAVYRSNLLREWSRLVKENTQDIATIMTLESGKPLRESMAEVAYARSFLDYYAAEAVRPNGFMVPTPFATESGAPRGHIMAVQQAVGTVALLAPWNFPAAMVSTT